LGGFDTSLCDVQSTRRLPLRRFKLRRWSCSSPESGPDRASQHISSAGPTYERMLIQVEAGTRGLDQHGVVGLLASFHMDGWLAGWMDVVTLRPKLQS